MRVCVYIYMYICICRAQNAYTKKCLLGERLARISRPRLLFIHLTEPFGLSVEK